MLSVFNLSLSSGERTIFHDISFELKPREVLFLKGANGAGKSSLLSTLVGVIKPTTGEIKNTFKETSFLFQESKRQFIAPIVIDDVCFTPMCKGEEEAGKERALALMDRFHLRHLKDEYISNLSGGEQKLVALLGVLITSSELLLLDEPTNHLDARNRALFYEYLEEDLKRGARSYIIATHDGYLLDLARSSSRYNILEL